MRLKRFLVTAIEWTCDKLDKVPCWDHLDHKWYRYGGWGCRMSIGRFSAELDEKWKTGVWK